MFKHLLKLIWNRKRSHALIIVEITLSFLVIFGIGALAVYNWTLYQKPLGFNYENGLQIIIRNGGDWTETDGQRLEQAILALNDMQEVDSAFAMLFGPFRGWRSTSNFEYNGITVDGSQNRISDGGHQALGLELLEGRWTGPEDIGLNWDTVVINRQMAEALFPNESALGKNIRPPEQDNPDYRDYRVVGVFEDFRQQGEFSEQGNYVMRRLAVEGHEQRAFSIMVYSQSASSQQLQQELIDTLQTIAPNWTVRIDSLEAMRADRIDNVTTPMSIMSLIAGFLIIMVGFGLFGVLWQSVTRRTGELGLRRAMGAHRGRIYRQIVAEMALTASIGLAIGIFIAIQLPILGTFPMINWTAAIGGMLISSAIILNLCILCSLYPGWLASRKSPAEALHYE